MKGGLKLYAEKNTEKKREGSPVQIRRKIDDRWCKIDNGFVHLDGAIVDLRIRAGFY